MAKLIYRYRKKEARLFHHLIAVKWSWPQTPLKSYYFEKQICNWFESDKQDLESKTTLSKSYKTWSHFPLPYPVNLLLLLLQILFSTAAEYLFRIGHVLFQILKCAVDAIHRHATKRLKQFSNVTVKLVDSVSFSGYSVFPVQVAVFGARITLGRAPWKRETKPTFSALSPNYTADRYHYPFPP